MRRKLLVPLFVVGVLFAWMALHMVDTSRSNPMLDVREVAEEKGLISSDAYVVSAQYGSQIFRRYAEGTLREPDGAGQVTVRLEKWLPFASWTVVTIQSER